MNTKISNDALLQRQHEVIQMQDKLIIDIEKGVNILHIQALEINSEAKSQVNILNNLDTTVDKAADELRIQSKQAEKIRLASNVCLLYIVVVLEVVVILGLLIFLFAPTWLKDIYDKNDVMNKFNLIFVYWNVRIFFEQNRKWINN